MLNNTFTAFFLDTTTAPGTPLTGLSATISIIDLTSNAVVVNNVAMVEVGLGNYKFTYGQYEPTKDYAWQCNPNSALAYITSGSTELPTGARGGSGIGGVSSEQLKSLEKSFETKLSQIWDKLNLPSDYNEIKSHIDLAKGDIITTIGSIELPELTKLDTTDIVKGIGILKAQNTKLASYLKGEDDKEKQEMEKMHKKMMDDMENAYAEMEKENGTEKNEKDKEKDEVMKAADEIIKELEDQNIKIGEENRAEIINKIKTLI